MNIANEHGETPLFVASEYGMIDAVKTLLEANADVNIANNHGKTSLSISSRTDVQNALMCYRDV